MCTIRVSISHDNNLVIIYVFSVKLRTDTAADCMNNGIDFFVFKDIGKLCFFCIDYFTS